jgi:hypothetical protein
MKKKQSVRRRGIAILAALIFIAMFSALSVGMLSMASANVQVSSNHHKSNLALNAALSGLECAQFVVAKTPTLSTDINNVTDQQADTVWANLCNQLKSHLGAQAVGNSHAFSDDDGSGTQILTSWIPYQGSQTSFRIRYYRYDDDPRAIYLECKGQHASIERTVEIKMRVTKDNKVLNYALAGRGRMWLAGDVTIHGDIYSSWNVAGISPFNMTDDSTVEGSLNTVLPWQDLLKQSYQMQTFAYDGSGNLILTDGRTVNSSGHLLTEGGQVITNSYGNPLNILNLGFEKEGHYNVAKDKWGNPIQGYVNGQPIGPVIYGNPVEAFDASGNRYYSSIDELQGTYENVNYSQPDQSNIPGLKIGDYNTSSYKNAIPGTAPSVSGSLIQNGVLPKTKIGKQTVPTQTEYFPHAAGNYKQKASSSSLALTRYVYENKTLRNIRVDGGTNALFKNCTFEEVLYVDCSTAGPTSTVSTYNNIRFENCTFNGVIVTNTPQALNSGWWMRNQLYFTGAATFKNESSIQEATILAPHFNVNLGNTNPNQNENNVLTGAIVGGIVDVRGNAQIYGTIISMADTSAYPSGYVTNIGATEDDGGSETLEIGDIGTIEITPDEDQMLPSGITTPIVLKPLKSTYKEKI